MSLSGDICFVLYHGGMSVALYRRYRPETFAEMIGQEHVTQPLMAALRNGKIGHAYLFSGPRGCGKTTSARVLARCLNCAEGPTDTPCGTCASCVELSREGAGSLDVIEIDAASHGSVEDARDLRERAIYAPVRDRYKIFIIDEAHMVTSHGFNALLKIVEEPPEHLKFIFATTEPEKVLGTIRSRTHHYPFRLIPPATLIDYTTTLLQQEKIEAEEGVLPLLVRAGGGSARDTLSILDQLLAGSENGLITLERTSALLGYTSEQHIRAFVQAFANGDAATIFSRVDEVVQSGQDPRRFLEDLLQRFRDLIIVNSGSTDQIASIFHGVSAQQLQEMIEQGSHFRPQLLSRIADILARGLDQMGGATAPRIQLELLLARVLCVLEGVRGAGAGAEHEGNRVAASAAEEVRGRGGLQQEPGEGGQARSAVEAQEDAQSHRASPSRSAAASVAASASSAAAAPLQEAPQTEENRENGTREEHDSYADNTPLSAKSETAEAEAEAEAPSTALAPQSSSVSQTPKQKLSLSDFQEFLHSQASQTGIRPSSTPETNSKKPKDQKRVLESLQSEMDRISSEPPSTAFLQEDHSPPPLQQSVPVTDPAQNTQEAPFSLEEIIDLWPQLLEEAEEESAEGHEALKGVIPLKVTVNDKGHTLVFGVAQPEQLERFKQAGAELLRSLLQQALGVHALFVRKKISSQEHAQFYEHLNQERERRAGIDPVYPERKNTPEQLPAAAEPPTTPSVETPTETAPDPSVTPDETEPVAQAEPKTSHQPTKGDAPTEPTPQQRPFTARSGARESASDAAPKYGESVVREIFDAQLIEERPFEISPHTKQSQPAKEAAPTPTAVEPQQEYRYEYRESDNDPPVTRHENPKVEMRQMPIHPEVPYTAPVLRRIKRKPADESTAQSET